MKKIYLKTGIVIISGFLVAAVIAGFFLFKPNKKPSSISKSLVFQRQLIGPYQYKGEVKGVLTASFAKEKDSGKVTISRGNSRLEFGLPINNPALTSQDVGLFQSTDVSFSSPDKIISAKYNLVPNGLKEEIILNKIPQENRLPISLKIENLKLKITPDGIPVFYDDKGSYQFHFERPFMKDGAGNVSYGVKYIFQDQKQNQFQKLTLWPKIC